MIECYKCKSGTFKVFVKVEGKALPLNITIECATCGWKYEIQ